MAKQRISYVGLADMDADMRKEMERCQREGTPRPESSAVRAHVKACFWFFANSWRDLFRNGVLDHPIDEADSQGFVSFDRPSGQNQIECAAQTNQARQAHRSAVD